MVKLHIPKELVESSELQPVKAVAIQLRLQKKHRFVELLRLKLNSQAVQVAVDVVMTQVKQLGTNVLQAAHK